MLSRDTGGVSRAAADRALRRRGGGASRPDRGQPDAVLATVKAWPGGGRVCGERVATASLDGACARRPGACAGRDEETALGSNKETDWKRTEAHQVSPSLMQVPTRRGVHRFQTGRGLISPRSGQMMCYENRTT